MNQIRERGLPFFSVIVANLNGKNFLETCLPSLYRQSFKDFEVIVIDNGSTDDSVHYISENFPEVKIINNRVNSFAKAINLGIKAASGNFFIVLNNDTELDNECLRQISEQLQKEQNKIGMWAVKILNFYNRNILDNTGLMIYPDGIFSGRGRGEVDNGQYDHSKEVLCPSGCMGVYSRQLIESVGCMDEDFQFYLEDGDLGLRARLKGWTCFFIPEAKVYHMLSATTGKFSPKKAFLVERNRVWLVVKLFSPSMLFCSLYYTFLRYVFNIISVFQKKGSAGKFTKNYSSLHLFFVLIDAWIKALLGIHLQYKKRHIINSEKQISSKQLRALLKRFSINVKELTLQNY